MALFRKGFTECCISSKVIGEDDYVICFPPFGDKATAQTVCCDDGCVLRDVFEVWEFREEVTTIVTEQWLLFTKDSPHAFEVLFEDENWFVTKSLFEKRVRFHFLKHLFMFEVLSTKWSEFTNIFKGDVSSGEYDLSINVISVKKFETFVKLICKSRIAQDRIRLTQAEWRQLSTIVATIL